MAISVGLAKVQGYLLRVGERRDYGGRTEYVLPGSCFRPLSGFEELLRDTQEFIEKERRRLRAMRRR